MWTSTMELSPRRVFLTRLLGYFWRGAYFSSVAPLQVQNVPRQPLPARNWVRVHNKLAGICGSDLHFIYADGDFRIAPAALPRHRLSYPGHEVVGEVIEVGEDVQHLQVGDRVALQYGSNCISRGVSSPCRSCAAGHYNLCEQGTFPGQEPIGGGWSEEMLLHESQLYRVPPTLSDEQAVLLEPSAVAIHAVLRRLPQAGEHVLIIGAGSIGLLVLQAIRALAPQARVSVMARHAFQVEQATRMGAEHILYPQSSYADAIAATGAKQYTGRFGNTTLLGGFDMVFDTIGTQRTLHHALRWTGAGGTIVLVGLSLHVMKIDLTPTWYQEVSIVGSMGHGTESWPPYSPTRRSTFDIAAEMIERNILYPEKLVSHRFALTDFSAALSTAANKGATRSIKVLFDYALMPASVVPNVRANARQRSPFRDRTTTTSQAAQVEEQPQPQHVQEAADAWEVAPMPPPSPVPPGPTWSQQVQPLPQSPQDDIFDIVDLDDDIAYSFPIDTASAPASQPIAPGEEQEVQSPQFASEETTIPAHLRSLYTDEQSLPALSDELPPPMEDLPETSTAHYAITEEPPAIIHREPQPIMLPSLAPEQAIEAGTPTTGEGAPEESPTTTQTRQSRSRFRPTRKATDNAPATNDPGDTLLE